MWIDSIGGSRYLRRHENVTRGTKRLRQSTGGALIILCAAILSCKLEDRARPGSSGPGCSTDVDCKGGRVCHDGKCQDPASTTVAQPVPPPQPSVSSAPLAPGEKPTSRQPARSTSSFFCIDRTRCKKGQLCCPGSQQLCIEEGNACEPGPDGGGETSWGFKCNRFTHEPCAEDEKCVYQQAGHGPLGMTSFCAK